MTQADVPQPRPGVGVGAMIVRDGEILLGRRLGALGRGTYGWCGGHLELGETFEDCARRETAEESGLTITGLRFLCLNNIMAYGRHYVDIEFVATVGPGEARLLEPDRIEAWGWYSLDALPTPLFEASRLAVETYKGLLQEGHPPIL